jgi:2-polyprenyl-3-methyl-5-hydroxy-6-metoxy-1,4-benzoquinol methylase
MTTSDCPACGTGCRPSTNYIVSCRACGHRWLNQSRQDHDAVDAATFICGYAGYQPDPRYVETVTRVVRTELVTRVPPPGRILDVGCGAGDFMSVARTFGYDAEGIDISETSAEICRSRGLNSRADDFLTFDFATNFDVIVMWDVVAGLRDPVSFLSRANSLLTNRGMLFVKTPAFGDLSVALSNLWPRVAGTLLGVPTHSQFFHRESLEVLLRRTALEPEWLVGGAARSPSAGGSLKRRLARKARSLASILSGDSNLYVTARSTRL